MKANIAVDISPQSHIWKDSGSRLLGQNIDS